MSFVNAKDENKHDEATATNNGGSVVVVARGSTPEQAVGDKSTEGPEEQGGHNRAIKESNYVGGW